MTQTQLILILTFAFVAATFAVQAIVGYVLSVHERYSRVNRRLTLMASGKTSAEAFEVLVRNPRHNSGSPIDRAHGRLLTICRRAGVAASPERLLAVTAGITIIVWLAALTLLGSRWPGPLATNLIFSLAGSAVLCFCALWLWISRKRAKRLRKLEEQLPMALDVVVRALRAGHPTVSAIKLVSEEVGDPIGSEFGFVVDETTYGIEFREALAHFAERTGSPDVHFFAVSVAVQNDTGGNLAEILGRLSDVVRARGSLHKRVKALSSEGKMSATLLSALPPFLIGVIGLAQPEFYTSKFSDPIFWPTVAGVCVLYLLGWVIIHRIVNFKY